MPREWKEKERRLAKESKKEKWHQAKEGQVSAPLIIDPTAGNLATESLYDNEAVRQIMARHREVMKEFREAEFTKKLERA